ncbi:hypothetical protein ABZ330_33150 [Streptomyces sp. NPDC006172]|uniref:hypothetical protein n=1 Tax=Streptomyces sp. NPDC006172 TaxID=3154470 RepID=UPI0033E8A164
MLHDTAARVIAVAGLALLPALGPAHGASAEAASPPRADGPSTAVRLDYHVPQGTTLEAGDPLWFSVRGMPPGWDTVEITSPALVEPITLTPLEKGSTESVQTNKAGTEHRIRPGLRPGVYPATATSHGRTLATTRLEVVAEGSAQISRFVIGPADAFPGTDVSAAVRPGSDVRLVLTDLRAAPGEDSVTVSSPVFDAPVTLTTGSPDDPGCKCDDGGTVYAGHARLRDDVPEGRYAVTALSHHGRETTNRQLTVTGKPVPHGPSRTAVATAAATAAALAFAAVLAWRRRSRRSAPGR